jgi:hypothetical protein
MAEPITTASGPAPLNAERRSLWRRILDSKILGSLALLFISLCALIAVVGLVATNQERARRLSVQDGRIAAQGQQIQQLQDQISCRSRIITDFDIARGKFTLSEGVVLLSNSAILNSLARGVPVMAEATKANEDAKALLATDSAVFQRAIDKRSKTDVLCPDPAPSHKP